MKCENCGIEHKGTYGSGRFCSKKCARGFSTKAKRKEINETVRKKLTKNKETIKLICEYCKTQFEVKLNKKQQQCCSISCATKLRGGWASAHKKVNWSEVNKKSYADGHNYVAGGTTKWYDYKGIKVQGTYELRVCFILDKWKEQKRIKNWEYTNDRIKYIGLDNKEHSYLLDFKVFDNYGSFYYIETKGYKKNDDELKWKAVKDNGYKLEIWFDKEIKNKEMEYVV